MTDLDSTQNNLKVELPSDLKTKSNMVSSMILKICLLIADYFNFQNNFLCESYIYLLFCIIVYGLFLFYFYEKIKNFKTEFIFFL